MGSLNRLTQRSRPNEEPWPELERRNFRIEKAERIFEFAEIQPTEPSNVLVLHFPGFGMDGIADAESIHVSMGQKYHTLALKGYGHIYSRDALVEAISSAIQITGQGKKVVLQGNSFGATIIYDLVSDQKTRDFLERNNIVGAILETPVLDRMHLAAKLKNLPDAMLVWGAQQIAQIRSGPIGRGKELDKHMLQEALRVKSGGKIEIPIHVIFAQNESLANNEQTLVTLQKQAEKMSIDTVSSSPSNGHVIANYEAMRESEIAIVDRFCGRGEASTTTT